MVHCTRQHQCYTEVCLRRVYSRRHSDKCTLPAKLEMVNKGIVKSRNPTLANGMKALNQFQRNVYPLSIYLSV